jgi:hypothetical protein
MTYTKEQTYGAVALAVIVVIILIMILKTYYPQAIPQWAHGTSHMAAKTAQSYHSEKAAKRAY